MKDTKLYETLTNDNDFLEKLGAAATPAEVQQFLMEKGISISAAEAEEVLRKRAAQKGNSLNLTWTWWLGEKQAACSVAAKITKAA